MNIWKRYELKERAKGVLKVNYWIAFVVALIFVMISGGLSLSNSGWKTNYNFNTRWNDRWENRWNSEWEDQWDFDWDADYDTFREFIREFPDDFRENIIESDLGYMLRWILPFAFGIIVIGATIAGLIGLALRILVINPLRMGCRAFFKTSAESPHKNMNDLGLGFRDGNYGSVVKTMFFRDLYTFLWTLLFIVPGIIKAYSYRMVPYILADNPKMDANEAITLSRKMMNGQKWKTFVLDLSFLGWYLLGILAFCVGTLFVHPYKFSTDAQLYLALRGTADEALNVDRPNLTEAQA